MRVINKTKSSILSDVVIIADNPFKRMAGLLGRKNFEKGSALVIKPCCQVHTFFMRFAIDVLFVDKENRVIGAVSDLRPFRLSPLYFNSAFVIELPAGTIAATRTVKDDVLQLS